MGQEKKPSNKKITFKEIAQLTNLSVGTVSRYFNDYNISDKAKIKIKKVVEELHYIPNFAASSVKKTPQDVYLILPYNDQRNDNEEVINGIKSYLENTTYNFFINLSSENSDIYLKDLKNIIQRNPKAIIIFLPMNPNQELQDFVLRIENIITVFYNPGINAALENAVYLDDFNSFKELTERTYQKYRPEKMAFLGINDFDKTTGLQRRFGFEAANVPKNVKQSYTIEKNKYQLAKLEIEKILFEKPDVIICATHTIALAVSKIVQIKKAEQPKITDIGYDVPILNLANADMTIFIDYFLIGYELATKIFEPNRKTNKAYKIIDLF